MQNKELWSRLCAFEFDAKTGSAPYSVKLARAEGWSQAYTARVIEEYRRFLYLTQVSERQITPSIPVDAAWHMHLTFTRDYWEELCPKVIGAPVHHQPCAGEEEMPRYRSQYAETLALYEREFGTPAPEEIWRRETPKATERPAEPANQQQAPSGFKALALSETGSGTTGIALAASVFALVALGGMHAFGAAEVPPLIYLILIVIVAYTAYEFLTYRKRRKKRGADDDEGGWFDFDFGSGRRRGRDEDRDHDNDGGSNDSGSSDGGGGGCGGCGGGD